MYAWAIRKERHGPPETSMQIEVVPTWPIGEDEVLVFVMAAGVNYNGVWAGLGQPISPLDVHKQPFHIAGSDASGIVWAIGDKVRRWKVGDEVIVHCNQDDGDDEDCNGGDPLLSPSQRIWGYETPDGSFAQFCRVQSRQLMPKPAHLTWEESACYTLTLATAYRMLFGHPPHTLKPGDNVLVWGASGGLGVFGVQLVAASGANAIGVVSDESKAEYVFNLGAKGVINRKDFKCWGQMPTVNTPEYNDWTKEARRFGKAIWDITGKRDVDIVFEHPGEQTVPGLVPGGQARRHGGVLRRHHRLQPHLRCALCVDAAEAHPGLAFRPSEAGERRQPVRARAPHRPVHERGVPVGRRSRARTRRCGRTSTRPATWRCWSTRRGRACGPSRMRWKRSRWAARIITDAPRLAMVFTARLQIRTGSGGARPPDTRCGLRCNDGHTFGTDGENKGDIPAERWYPSGDLRGRLCARSAPPSFSVEKD